MKTILELVKSLGTNGSQLFRFGCCWQGHDFRHLRNRILHVRADRGKWAVAILIPQLLQNLQLLGHVNAMAQFSFSFFLLCLFVVTLTFGNKLLLLLVQQSLKHFESGIHFSSPD